jgi:hypothetical protein
VLTGCLGGGVAEAPVTLVLTTSPTLAG